MDAGQQVGGKRAFELGVGGLNEFFRTFFAFIRGRRFSADFIVRMLGFLERHEAGKAIQIVDVDARWIFRKCFFALFSHLVVTAFFEDEQAGF